VIAKGDGSYDVWPKLSAAEIEVAVRMKQRK
jgi:hypothetical protein